jgi:pimeloyl-ACP methyl ester carboxylesterase
MRRRLAFAALLLLALLGALAWWAWAPDTDAEAMRARYGGVTSQYVDLGGGLVMHVRDVGPRDAPVLVLLHGSNASLHTWEEWAARLGSRWRIVTLDQIGHGLTGPSPARRYDAAAFVDTLTRLLDAKGIERAVIGGNSMGGGVAWRFALARPERVQGLLLVNAVGAPVAAQGSPPLGFRLARLPIAREAMLRFTPRALVASGLRDSVAQPDAIDDATIDLYWELLRFPGNRQATLDRFTTGRDPPADPAALARIAVPTLILWGEEDRLLPPDQGRWLADHIPGARLIVYPDTGHLPMEERPDATARDVAAWLEQVAPPGGAGESGD